MISKKKIIIELTFNESETLSKIWGRKLSPENLNNVSSSTYMGEELYFHFQPL